MFKEWAILLWKKIWRSRHGGGEHARCDEWHTHTGSDDCWATLLGMQRTVPSSTVKLVDTFHFHCSWPARRQLLRNTCRGGAAKNPAENQLALVVGAAASSLSVEPSCEKKVSCVFSTSNNIILNQLRSTYSVHEGTILELFFGLNKFFICRNIDTLMWGIKTQM